MIKANDYSVEPSKEVMVSKRGLEELSLFSRAEGAEYRVLSGLSRCAGERKDQHGQGKELKDRGQKTNRA